MDDLANAIETARYHLSIDSDLGIEPHGYIIIDVPAIGPNGGHYAAGCRVYSEIPQAPGGIMTPGELPPGEIVAHMAADGTVTFA